jgi:hypothetical protein
MIMTLELSDLDTIKENALRKFTERVGNAGTNREQLEREAFRLESQLEQLYSFTAVMARRESDVGATAALWANLVRTCDVFASKIFQLAQQYSLATAPYDNMLDIRSAAEELRALHSA